jgi:hypothetical protein
VSAVRRVAAQLTATTRRLRVALKDWDMRAAVPRDVTYLALHHQRMLRFMAARRKLGDATARAGSPGPAATDRRTFRGRGCRFRRRPFV